MVITLDAVDNVTDLLIMTYDAFNPKGWKSIQVTLEEALEDIGTLESAADPQLKPAIDALTKALNTILKGIGNNQITDYVTARAQFKRLAGFPFLKFCRTRYPTKGDMLAKLSIFI